MNGDDGDVVVPSHLVIRHPVEILESLKPVVVVVPEHGFVEELDNGHRLPPLCGVGPLCNSSKHIGSTLQILVAVVKSDSSCMARMIVSVLRIHRAHI